MKVEAAVTLHNRFDFEVRDAQSGELKQQARAYNIVLDQMWTRLCTGSAYFVNIHFGTGTGVLAPARTSLFTHLGTRTAVDDTIVRAVPNSSWRRRVVLNPEEFVGANLSEVGVAFSSGTTNLVTHAQLEDAAGNPITILKTSLDVVTIFATIFVTFSAPAGVVYTNMPNNNALVNYLIGGAAAPSGVFSLGEAVGAGSTQMTGLGSQPALGSTATATWTADTANRRRTTGIMRFGTTVGNGHAAEFAFSNVFRARLPLSGVFTGQPYTNVPLGNGDGATRDFVLPSRNIRQGTVNVKMGGATAVGTLRSIGNNINYAHRGLVPGSGVTYNVAVTLDGMVVAATSADWPFGIVYDHRGATWVTRPTPASPPSSPTRGVALSSNGALLAMVSEGTPFIHTYDWNGAAWIARPTPAVTPTDSGQGVVFSGNGNVMASVQIFPPYLRTYDWNGTAWIARPAPAVVSSSHHRSVALSSNGNVLAVTFDSSPSFRTYDWNGAAWIARPTPAVFPPQGGGGVALSSNGNILAVVLSSTPFIYTYDWNGAAWIARPTPAVTPQGNSSSAVALSSDGNILVAAMTGNNNLSMVYDWNGAAWIARPTPAVTMDGEGVAVSGDAGIVAVATHWGTTIWDARARNMAFTFDTPPPAGASITADYIVDGVHKTDQFVIDTGFSIQFGTPT